MAEEALSWRSGFQNLISSWLLPKFEFEKYVGDFRCISEVWRSLVFLRIIEGQGLKKL